MILLRPIILAPMAGGVTTPELCIAVANAGGLPFLASGYLTTEELIKQIKEYESHTSSDYGINIFYPDRSRLVKDDFFSYKENFINHKYNYMLSDDIIYNDDFYHEKIDIALSSRAKYISFTFGHPDEEIINKIKSFNKKVILYATSKLGINYIAKSNADIIGIQGIDAGGHQSSVYGLDDDSERYDLETLIEYSNSISNKLIIVGGGVSSKNDVLRLIRKGANAVQIRTMFLLANEAGTKNAHKHAILNFKDRNTILTKSFTGRSARAIENDFTNKFNELSIDGYPEVHHLTKGIRAEANKKDDSENINLWAGVGFKYASKDSAKNIINRLSPYIIVSNDSSDDDFEKICIIGGGPRGLALMERLISNFNDDDKKISIYWFDDYVHGSGRIWNPYNPTYFLMNTICSQLSAFPDQSTGLNDKYISGPTMYDWIVSDDSLHWLQDDFELLEQRGSINENSYPSRSLYGAYLVWAANKIISSKSKKQKAKSKKQKAKSKKQKAKI